MLEARVAHLEKTTERMDAKLDKLDTKLDRLVEGLAEVKGRVASLPTTWQMITLVFGILGGAFVIMRFALPHAGG